MGKPTVKKMTGRRQVMMSLPDFHAKVERKQDRVALIENEKRGRDELREKETVQFGIIAGLLTAAVKRNNQQTLLQNKDAAAVSDAENFGGATLIVGEFTERDKIKTQMLAAAKDRSAESVGAKPVGPLAKPVRPFLRKSSGMLPVKLSHPQPTQNNWDAAQQQAPVAKRQPALFEKRGSCAPTTPPNKPKVAAGIEEFVVVEKAEAPSATPAPVAPTGWKFW